MMTPDFIIPLILSLFVGVSVFLLIWSVFRIPLPDEPPVHRRIVLAIGAGQRQTLFEQPLLAPVMALAMMCARRFNVASIRTRVRENLDASGNPNGYSVEEYLAICLICSVFLAVLSAAVAIALAGTFNPLTAMIMAVAGFAVPLWTLKDAANRRKLRIGKQLPYTLDLVALMMGAGSTFTEAIETIVNDNPDDDFNQELRIVQSEIDFGTQRATALMNLANRVPLESLRSVIGAINQAEAMGTPLSQILKNQSDMMRMHRSVRAEKLSASASLRILFPSMLILVAVVIFVFGPMIIRYSRDGLF